MPETQAMPTYLTADEARKILRVGLTKTYELIKSREIASLRVGKRILIIRDSLDAFMQRNTRPVKRHFLTSHRYHDSRGAI